MYSSTFSICTLHRHLTVVAAVQPHASTIYTLFRCFHLIFFLFCFRYIVFFVVAVSRFITTIAYNLKRAHTATKFNTDKIKRTTKERKIKRMTKKTMIKIPRKAVFVVLCFPWRWLMLFVLSKLKRAGFLFSSIYVCRIWASSYLNIWMTIDIWHKNKTPAENLWRTMHKCGVFIQIFFCCRLRCFTDVAFSAFAFIVLWTAVFVGYNRTTIPRFFKIPLHLQLATIRNEFDEFAWST